VLLSTVEPEISGYLPLKVIHFQKLNSFFKFAKSKCEKRFLQLGWMHSVQALLSTVEPDISGSFSLKLIIFQKTVSSKKYFYNSCGCLPYAHYYQQ
jgi:hypothetical protein